MAPILTRVGNAFGFGASSGGGGPSGPNMEATGGTIIDQPGTDAEGHPDGAGSYKVHVWTNPGNGLSPYNSSFVITSCNGPGVIQYLVVGGGGSGGSNNGGGGGAGGFRQGTYTVTASGGGSNNGTYAVTTGSGGNTQPSPTNAQSDNGLEGGTSNFGPPNPDPNNPTGGIYAGGGGGGVSGNTTEPKARASADVPAAGGGGGGGSRGNYNSPNGQNAGTSGSYGEPGWIGSGGQGGGGGGAGARGGPPTGIWKGGIGLSNAWIPPSYGTPGPGTGRYFAGGGSGAREGEPTLAPGTYGGGGNGYTGYSPYPRANYEDYSPLTTPTPGIGGRGARSTGGGGGGEINGGLMAIAGDGIVAVRYRYT